MYKLLIVDDEIGMRALLNEVFKKEYEVLMAEGSKEALALVEREMPHLVIMDKGLRGEDGLWVFEKIRDIHPAIQGIMLTGYRDEEERQRALKVGFKDCFTKPFDIIDLRKYVKEVLS